MKRIGLLGAGVAALAMAAMPSAHAAQYTIKASGPGVGLTLVKKTFVDQGHCADSAASTANGLDGLILRTTWVADTIVTVSYDGVYAPTSASKLAPAFYTSGCTQILSSLVDGGWGGQALRVKVPAGTKWLVIEAINTANLDVRVTP